MKKHTRGILVCLLLISIGFNLSNYKNLLEAQGKIQRVNSIITSNVESNIRQSMLYIQELVETNSPRSLQDLERTIGNLTVAFNQWVDLNQNPRRSNKIMEKGLTSIETMRSTIIHHLAQQYKINGNQLMKYDIEMLENTNQQLNKLLLVFHNIENRLLNLKDSATSDGGLGQIISSMDESNRLYRHSKLPNKHPRYIDYTEAKTSALEKFSFLEDYTIKEEKQEVSIKEGVHYYEFNFFEEEEIYTLWIDATDGEIRNFELKRKESNGNNISQNHAVAIARKFVQEFYKGEMKEEMFYIDETDESAGIYSFRFTPIIEEVEIVSDAYTVNVSTSSGEVIKFTNDFSGTEFHKKEADTDVEEVLEKYYEEYGDMDYNGLAIVRSFYTRYEPKLTHSFRTVQDQQQSMVFIDVATGMSINQLYYVYHPVIN